MKSFQLSWFLLTIIRTIRRPVFTVKESAFYITQLISIDKESRSSSRSKKTQKRISVTLPPEVVLPSAGLEYTRLSDEESLQLATSLSQSFYRHVSRYAS